MFASDCDEMGLLYEALKPALPDQDRYEMIPDPSGKAGRFPLDLH